jgi:hypothetical protein
MNTQTVGVNTYGESEYMKDYSDFKNHQKFCPKCLSPITGDGFKGYCDKNCYNEDAREQFELAEEIAESVYWNI